MTSVVFKQEIFFDNNEGVTYILLNCGTSCVPRLGNQAVAHLLSFGLPENSYEEEKFIFP